MLGWLIITAIFGFTLSYSIGANDAANSLATSYGSKALSLHKLLILGAIFEFVGAMFLSSEVAATLSYKIIPTIDKLSLLDQHVMMFSVCLAAFIFIMSSAQFGMPISGTHSVVGSLVGAGLVGAGASNLNYKKLGKIVLSWFVSPCLASVLCATLLLAVMMLTMNIERLSYRTRLLSFQLITGVCFEIIAHVIANILKLQDRLILSIVSFVAGFLIVRVLMVLVLSRSS
jgi:phosphate/sulfate permease